MTPKAPTMTKRLKQLIADLLAKLQSLVDVPPVLRPIPVQTRPPEKKDLERWRNEGGN